MIDVNNPKIQKYVEEALQKQREEIAERILWRNAGAPYMEPSMEEIEYYTGLSLDQLAKIEKKCKWKLQYREGYREGRLLAGVSIWRNFLDNLNDGDSSDRNIDDLFIETIAKDCGIIDPKNSDLTTWRENPVKCAVMELVSQGIGDTDIMDELKLTSDQFKKLYPTWKEQIAYHSIFSFELLDEEELEAAYQEKTSEDEKEILSVDTLEVKVLDVKILDGRRLLLTFMGGEKRVFDAHELNGPVFECLSDPEIFKTAGIEDGVVVWLNGEIDCAPEYMYEHSCPYEDADDDIKAEADACMERIKIKRAAEKNTFENSVRAIRVWADETYLWLELNDGRMLGVPRIWSSKIHHATIEQINDYELIGDGIGIYWSNLDEDIFVPNLLGNKLHGGFLYE